MSFSAQLHHLKMILPDLDIEMYKTVSSSKMDPEAKLQTILHKHFAAKQSRYLDQHLNNILHLEAVSINTLFPSKSIESILEQLKIFKDMPNRKEIVMRIIINFKTDSNNVENERKRNSIQSQDFDTVNNNEPIGKIRKLNEAVKLADEQPTTSMQNIHNYFVTDKPATITSSAIFKVEPFDCMSTNDYQIPDIMEHFDLPVVQWPIPSLTSSEPEVVVKNEVTPIDLKAEDGSYQQDYCTKQESLDLAPTEVHYVDNLPSPVYEENVISDPNNSVKFPGPTKFKVKTEFVENVQNHAINSSQEEDNTDDVELLNEPSTSSIKNENMSCRDNFDLVQYVHEITQAPKTLIRTFCKKLKLSTCRKPSSKLSNILVNSVMSVMVIKNLSTESYDLTEESSSCEELSVVKSESMEEVPIASSSYEPSLNITKLDTHLINTLCNMFPEACPDYIKNLCIGKEMSNEVLNDLINIIFAENDNYPKRPKIKYEPETEVMPKEEQFEYLKELLPDADPDYLFRFCNAIDGDPEKLKYFINDATEHKNYPTMKDYQRRQQLSAQQRQYTTEFSVENFIRVFPDPDAYFSDKSRKINLNQDDAHYALTYLRNEFNKLPIRTIQTVFSKNKSNIRKTFRDLRQVTADSNNLMKSVRKPIHLSLIKNIPLLQELAYYTHKNEIDKYLQEMKEKEQAEVQAAKAEGILKTCSCCFDDEILPKNIYFCENGCEFCKACVVKSTEIRFSEGKLDFPCLTCSSTFSLQTLQAVLLPKLFSKLAQKKALEEVKAAGIEELEMCPFCDFATIIPEGNNIFICMNPDCMKESCRLCKEPSHIPLRCDEIEKDEEVKARVFIENKMTEALLRKCWKCGVKFFKEEGCNKMTCSCGAQMCYLCGEPVTDYKHFNGNGGDRYDLCPLYSDTNTLNKENVLKGAEAAIAELGTVPIKNDPTEGIDQYFKERAKMFPQQHLLAGQINNLLERAGQLNNLVEQAGLLQPPAALFLNNRHRRHHRHH